MGWLKLLRGIGQPGAGSFTPRVIAVILIILLIFLAWTFYWLLDAQRQALYEEKQLALEDNVRLGRSLCKGLDEEVRAGNLSLDEAQQQALEMLGSMRYGPGSGGYYFVADKQGQLIFHPLRPNQANSLAGRGVLGQEQQLLAEMARQHRGIWYRLYRICPQVGWWRARRAENSGLWHI